MSEFLASLSPIELPVIIFMMVFSLGIAIFHTVILSDLFKTKLPGWFFFVVNPVAIGLGYLIYPPLGALIFFLMFVLVFILCITGGIYSASKSKLQKYNKMVKIKGKKRAIWMTIGSITLPLLFIALFLFSGSYAFIFVVALIILQKILPNSQNRFLKLQAILPTSSIRSMAMGLVEVKGVLRMGDPLRAPMDKKECIGYRYTVEKISRDKNGEEGFSIISDETVLNHFYIEDNTGKVLVIGDSLELLWVPIDNRERRSGKRYTQYLLLKDDEMLLIGMATNIKQQTVITREPIKNIFTISPLNAVNKWNKYLPLLRAGLMSLIVVGLISSLILLSDMNIVGNTVNISLNMMWR